MWAELMLSPAGDMVKLTRLRSACQDVGLEGRKGDWKKDICLTTVGAQENSGGSVASPSGARRAWMPLFSSGGDHAATEVSSFL